MPTRKKPIKNGSKSKAPKKIIKKVSGNKSKVSKPRKRERKTAKKNIPKGKQINKKRILQLPKKTLKNGNKPKTLRKVSGKRRATIGSKTKSGNSDRMGKSKLVAKTGKNVSRKKPQRKNAKTVRKPNKFRASKRQDKSTSKKRGKKLGEKTKGKKRTTKKLKKGLLPVILKKLYVKDKDGNNTKYISDVVRIDLDEKKFKDKIAQLNQWSGTDLLWYINRHTLLPRSFQIILRTKKGNKTYERANKMAPFGMAVTVENVLQEIKNKLIEYQDSYIDKLAESSEYSDDGDLGKSDWVFNPNYIASVFVRFFYAPEL